MSLIIFLLTLLWPALGWPATFTLSWIDTAANEEGFTIERQANGGSFLPLVTGLAVNAQNYSDANVLSNSTYCYRVRAYNSIGDSSWSNVACRVASMPLPPQQLMGTYQIVVQPPPPPVVAKINFQPAGAPVPSGYLADTGAVYVAARGYGWSRNISGNGRDRNVNLDQRLDTLLANSHDNSGAVATWRYDLPNGNYLVTLVSGDPGYPQGPQRVTIEGIVAINNVTTTVNQFTTANALVAVTDGHLDIQLGPSSANTVLNYIEIAQ